MAPKSAPVLGIVREENPYYILLDFSQRDFQRPTLEFINDALDAGWSFDLSTLFDDTTDFVFLGKRSQRDAFIKVVEEYYNIDRTEESGTTRDELFLVDSDDEDEEEEEEETEEDTTEEAPKPASKPKKKGSLWDW